MGKTGQKFTEKIAAGTAFFIVASLMSMLPVQAAGLHSQEDVTEFVKAANVICAAQMMDVESDLKTYKGILPNSNGQYKDQKISIYHVAGHPKWKKTAETIKQTENQQEQFYGSSFLCGGLQHCREYQLEKSTKGSYWMYCRGIGLWLDEQKGEDITQFIGQREKKVVKSEISE